MLKFHEALPGGFARKSEGMAAVICFSYALSCYGTNINGDEY